MLDESVPVRSAGGFGADSASDVGPAKVDEAPETGVVPGFPGGGSGRGGLLTSLALAGQALVVRFADAVLDGQASECVGVEGVHVGLLVREQVGLVDGPSCAGAEDFSVRLPTPRATDAERRRAGARWPSGAMPYPGPESQGVDARPAQPDHVDPCEPLHDSLTDRLVAPTRCASWVWLSGIVGVTFSTGREARGPRANAAK